MGMRWRASVKGPNICEETWLTSPPERVTERGVAAPQGNRTLYYSESPTPSVRAAAMLVHAFKIRTSFWPE